MSAEGVLGGIEVVVVVGMGVGMMGVGERDYLGGGGVAAAAAAAGAAADLLSAVEAASC